MYAMGIFICQIWDSPAKKCQEPLKKLVLDSKVAKAQERNFYEIPLEKKFLSI